jgi:hypothetical protein
VGDGWTLAEDRALLLAQGRYPPRLAAIDAPNINAFRPRHRPEDLHAATPEVDRAILRNGLKALRDAPNGDALLHDVDVYIRGVNARSPRRQRRRRSRSPRVDVFAVNALVGEIFGQGGGDEARRSQMYSALASGSASRARSACSTT